MRCSRRNTSNVPTPCYAMARYNSTTQNGTNIRNFCYFGLTRLALGLSMPGSYTFAPISEKLSRMGHEVFARIRNTLILGLGSHSHSNRFSLSWLAQRACNIYALSVGYSTFTLKTLQRRHCEVANSARGWGAFYLNRITVSIA